MANFPEYIWQCPRCEVFHVNTIHLIIVPHYNGWVTYFCPACKIPVNLVRVQWVQKK